MTTPLPVSQPEPDNTIDEPVWVTLKRDASEIVFRLSHVIIPRGRTRKVLQDWDLWGPLILCLLLAVMLSLSAPSEQSALMFASVFVIVWLGSAIVTVNAILLGGTPSLFQTVCLLGYCLFPLVLAAGLSLIVPFLTARAIFVSVGLLWSSLASVGFVSDLVPQGRKALAVYPITLFYICIAWMVLINGSRT